jgi:hypothetical protein
VKAIEWFGGRHAQHPFRSCQLFIYYFRSNYRASFPLGWNPVSNPVQICIIKGPLKNNFGLYKLFPDNMEVRFSGATCDG